MGDDIGAKAICKQFVEKSLIAPREAKWPGMFDSADVRQTGPETWRVAYWVDAANALGVHIRLDYVCIVRYLGNDRWQLEVLNMPNPLETGDVQFDTPVPGPTSTPIKCKMRMGNTYIEVDCDQLH